MLVLVLVPVWDEIVLSEWWSVIELRGRVRGRREGEGEGRGEVGGAAVGDMTNVSYCELESSHLPEQSLVPQSYRRHPQRSERRQRP